MASVRPNWVKERDELFAAVEHGEQKKVEKLLSSGVNVDEDILYGFFSWTPLMIAASNGDVEITKILLAAGAKTKAKYKKGADSLIVASFNGHQEVVKLLLAAGAKVNKVTHYYQTALNLAEKEGHNKIVELLKKAGATKTQEEMFWEEERARLEEHYKDHKEEEPPSEHYKRWLKVRQEFNPDDWLRGKR